MTKAAELSVNAKQLSREPLPEHSIVFCPKCQNLLNPSGLQQTNRGTQFVYTCSECSAEFAFVPVMEFRLFEVIPK